MKTEYLIYGALGLLALYLFTRPRSLSIGQPYTGSAVAYNPPYAGPPLGTSATSAPSNLSTILNTVGVLGQAASNAYGSYVDSQNGY